MRNSIVLALMLVAGGAYADHAKEAVTAATAVIDKADQAYNAGDAAALTGLLDKGYFGGGISTGARFADMAAGKAHLEQGVAKGGRFVRESLTVKADDMGDVAWYIADYTFIPKVPPGALPLRSPMRESGVLVRHGKEWRFAMMHMSALNEEPRTPPPVPEPQVKAKPAPTKP